MDENKELHFIDSRTLTMTIRHQNYPTADDLMVMLHRIDRDANIGKIDIRPNPEVCTVIIESEIVGTHTRM